MSRGTGVGGGLRHRGEEAPEELVRGAGQSEGDGVCVDEHSSSTNFVPSPPAATDLQPSARMARVSTVAVVVPVGEGAHTTTKTWGWASVHERM